MDHTVTKLSVSLCVFVRRFRYSRRVEVEYTWGGALCISRNNGSVFGEIAQVFQRAVLQRPGSDPQHHLPAS
jgi:hypothetical protein